VGHETGSTESSAEHMEDTCLCLDVPRLLGQDSDLPAELAQVPATVQGLHRQIGPAITEAMRAKAADSKASRQYFTHVAYIVCMTGLSGDTRGGNPQRRKRCSPPGVPAKLYGLASRQLRAALRLKAFSSLFLVWARMTLCYPICERQR
jgi:hypothetical protein